jgi:CRP-like cAMP-binding protein
MIDTLLATLATAFAGLPKEGLARLAERGKPCNFPAGAELMHQGDEGDCLYVVLRGQVQVERSHPDLAEPLILAELGPGEVVGEMAVLDRGPRSATVTAVEDTETVELSREAFASTLVAYPEVLMALLRMLAQRLRVTDELAEQVFRTVRS